MYQAERGRSADVSREEEGAQRRGASGLLLLLRLRLGLGLPACLLACLPACCCRRRRCCRARERGRHTHTPTEHQGAACCLAPVLLPAFPAAAAAAAAAAASLRPGVRGREGSTRRAQDGWRAGQRRPCLLAAGPGGGVPAAACPGEESGPLPSHLQLHQGLRHLCRVVHRAALHPRRHRLLVSHAGAPELGGRDGEGSVFPLSEGGGVKCSGVDLFELSSLYS